jgi:aspartate-semialdehyde dehydrogenase
MRVAIVGATGAVGREMTRLLDERDFPVDEFVPLASARSAGRLVTFRGDDHEVRELSVEAVRGVDVAFVSAGATTSTRFLPEIAANGTLCIDNSSAFRMEPGVPLVVPHVNPEALEGWPHPGIVAVPNCTTITAVLPLGPLHRAAGLRSLVLSSYQSVSGAGHKGVSELLEQVEKVRGGEEELAHPDHEALPRGDVMGTTIAYNVVPRIGAFEDDGSTGEESKMIAEPRKILGIPDLSVVATSVRVPTIVGHGASIVAGFSRQITPDEARSVLADAPGVEIRDDPANGVFPTPLDSAGLDVALVGRIRQPPEQPDTLALFSCADNLRLGAALDAILIAEQLFS